MADTDLSKPLISVVMPVYNAGKFLASAIESILNQTYTNFEFIIINDGSTDGSETIINQYAQKDARIKMFNIYPNKGIVNALNVGVSNSNGKYIARMDNDDISLPKRLEMQVAYLELHPEIGVLGGSVQLIYTKTGKDKTISKYPGTHALISWSFCYWSPMIHPVVMLRRAIFGTAEPYQNDFICAEDYDLWTRLIWQTRFANLDQTLLELRKHETNMTVLGADESYDSSIRISQRYINQLLQKNVSKEIVEILRGGESDQIDKIIQASDVVIELREHFKKNVALNKNEKRYIEKDAAIRTVRLTLGVIPLINAWTILVSAVFYNPIPVIAYIAKIIKRQLKKTLTKLRKDAETAGDKKLP